MQANGVVDEMNNNATSWLWPAKQDTHHRTPLREGSLVLEILRESGLMSVCRAKDRRVHIVLSHL